MVHNGLSVDVRGARFARALGLGPSGSLIVDVLGKADTGRTKKGRRRKPSGEYIDEPGGFHV